MNKRVQHSLVLLIFSLVISVSEVSASSDVLTTNSKKQSMIWLRNESFAIDVDGINIVNGPDYNVMKFLAERLPEYAHRFESYPLKRNWLLIKSPQPVDETYCFYSAGVTNERKQWGLYSAPITIILPYPIVSLKGALQEYDKGGAVSIEDLFSAGLYTVMFDGMENMWTKVVNDRRKFDSLILRLNAGHQDVYDVSAKLLKSKRIDFAYVGAGYTEITALERRHGISLKVYKLKELRGNVVGGRRILCAKSENGAVIIDRLNKALLEISDEPETSVQFRDLNFNGIGYHPDLKPTFDRHWLSLRAKILAESKKGL